MTALGGTTLALGFAAWQGAGTLDVADGLLPLAVMSAAGSYVGGARPAKHMPAQQVISGVLAMCVPVLGERLDAATLLFSLAVIATVALSKRMAVGTPAPASRS